MPQRLSEQASQPHSGTRRILARKSSREVAAQCGPLAKVSVNESKLADIMQKKFSFPAIDTQELRFMKIKKGKTSEKRR
jgi:hypothetical protein